MDDESLDQVIREAIKNSIWDVPAVADEPEVRLTFWKVFEVEGVRRLVGYHADGFEGRVSTRVLDFDPELPCARTASGRTYILEGPMGFHRDSDWVLGRWLWARGLTNKDLRYLSAEELLLKSDS